ncbi:hypothetical protein E4U02_04220 [Microbacterium paludicola]|uniref:Uncharacterized protein n=1 Tax=Microbacterium paludicola TaxID=300019 RepID=A0A4Y9FZI1_9MICO|nr:hypothetical protein [Microbacterium paludicola]MBF0815610.1 hypothetical protein [Microbacterium paludicola]TFU33666.1 hypothetical protein E4U02_04220 [Microbacterium paludicola]
MSQLPPVPPPPVAGPFDPPPRPYRPGLRGWGVGLIWTGSVLLVIAIAAATFSLFFFLRTVPFGVLDLSGRPGPEVIASGSLPGEAALDVAEPARYTIWQMSSSSDPDFLSFEDVTVTGPETVRVDPAFVAETSSSGSTVASAVASFQADEAGSYLITVASGADAPEDALFLVTEGGGFGEFFLGLNATILLGFAGIGGGLLGTTLLTIGIVLRVLAGKKPTRG